MIFGVLTLLFLIPLLWMLRTAFADPGKALDLSAFFAPTLSNFSRV
jgi:ABC-type glycerol-3-phosphate transport system permease component